MRRHGRSDGGRRPKDSCAASTIKLPLSGKRPGNRIRVWLRNREVEHPVVRYETRERRLYGGCPEVIKVPIPKLEAGEKTVRWHHRILIVSDNSPTRA
jgi:hypothetical protein